MIDPKQRLHPREAVHRPPPDRDSGFVCFPMPPAAVPSTGKIVQHVAMPSIKKGNGFLCIAVHDGTGNGTARLLRGKRAKRKPGPKTAYTVHTVLAHHPKHADALAHANALNTLHNLPIFTPR